MGWEFLWIYLLVSAVLCAVGFKRFVWFLSIGYGFSVAGLGIAYLVTALVQGWELSFVTYLQAALFVAYGVRLSGFLLVREIKNANYRKVLNEAAKTDEKPMPLFVKFAIWVCVAVLYVAETSPLFFRVYNGDGKDIVLPLIGVLISLAGLALETLADRQKSAQKAQEPHMVATRGLFKPVRCPNYLGEIIFWTGVLVGGLNALNGVGQWLIAVCGYICLVYVMVNGAQRLDRRQEKQYGKDPKYRAYADHTPILLPLVPICHIGKYKED